MSPESASKTKVNLNVPETICNDRESLDKSDFTPANVKKEVSTEISEKTSSMETPVLSEISTDHVLLKRETKKSADRDDDVNEADMDEEDDETTLEEEEAKFFDADAVKAEVCELRVRVKWS